MSIRNYPMVLAAGESRTINARGNYISCIQGSAKFEVAPAGENPFEMEAGLSIGPFKNTVAKWVVTNTDASSNTLNLYLGDVPVRDARSVGTGTVTVTGNAVALAPNQLAHGTISVLVTATEIKAVRVNRKTLTIQNLGAAALFVGGSGVTVANGVQVAAGGSIEIDSGAEVYGISASGTLDVRYIETYLV